MVARPGSPLAGTSALSGEALCAMLSYALVAITVEFDNLLEARLPHSTTQGPMASSGRGPWLISQAMWSNLLQHVGDQGRSVRELRTAINCTNLPGMVRWGYLTVETSAGARRGDATIRLTHHGRTARTILAPLAREIEHAWQVRHGKPVIAELKQMLLGLIANLPAGLPHHLPVLGYGLKLTASSSYSDVALFGTVSEDTPLSTLLAQPLLQLMLEYQDISQRSLCIDANLLAALTDEDVSSRELGHLTGLFPSPLAMAKKMLGSLLDERAAPSGRGSVVRLNGKGMTVKRAFARNMLVVLDHWRARHGKNIDRLAALLLAIGADPAHRGMALFNQIPAYPAGWRAALKGPGVLPNCPAVLHRGGYPDGA